MEDRLILAIDNTIEYLSIILSIEDRIIDERYIKGSSAPSEIIAVRVLDALEQNRYTVDELGFIIVTLGPGSFTGIRVGLAFCKGLSSGKNIPLVGVPTLDALASSFVFMDGYYIFPVIDAKKGEVFSALYYMKNNSMYRRADYLSKKPGDAVKDIRTPCLCFGSGIDMCLPFIADLNDILIIRDGFRRVSGESLIREGLKRGPSMGGSDVKPIYGRRSEAEIKYNLDVDVHVR